MNITYLKYALEVERTGSISRAADALYTSQPHISKAIRELESAVGISLFYRTPRGAAPTEEGLVFLQRARELLTQLEDLEMSYRKTKNASQRFSLSAPRASYLCSAALALLQEFDPVLPFHMEYREGSNAEVLQQVGNGEVNLGILRYPICDKDHFSNALDERFLQRIPLWEFDARVLLSANSRLAGLSVAEKELLSGLTKLSFVDGSLSPTVARQRTKQEDERQVVLSSRAGLYEFLSCLPDAYAYSSPMPEEMLKQYALVQLKCSEAQRYQELLIYRKGYRLTGQDRLFCEKLKEIIGELK